MFKHILVAIDGSTNSRAALPAAIEVAKKFGGEIVVLHVSEHDRGHAVVFSLESPAEATMLVGDAVKNARDAGVTARGELRDVAAGHVAKAIVEEASANDIDMVVMGSRGLSDVEGLLVGSVTHEVMQAANVPVLVVKPAPKGTPAANGSVASF
jgi:nucleotide-binding universal stress UspA family protein